MIGRNERLFPQWIVRPERAVVTRDTIAKVAALEKLPLAAYHRVNAFNLEGSGCFGNLKNARGNACVDRIRVCCELVANEVGGIFGDGRFGVFLGEL